MMFLRRPWSWFGWCLAGVFLAAGCTSDVGPSGSLDLQLVLENGAEIDEVSWRITDPTGEMEEMAGVIDTSAPGSTASVEVFGIPAGDDYVITLSATSEDGGTTCEGSAEFDVIVGNVTEVHVMLKCKTEPDAGAVRVETWFNICAELIKVVVAPLQTSVGNDIDVFAAAIDEDDDPVDYLWTGTGGSFADPTARDTTYTCEEEGDQFITITVSDTEGCMDGWTVRVTCVDGGGMGGMDGGMGGAGGAAGAGGEGGAGGVAGAGGEGGAGGVGGAGGEGGSGGMAGVGGEGGAGGAAGAGGVGGVGGGTGGAGGTAGAGGGMGGAGGMGGIGGGVCIPDGGAQWAGAVTNRPCGAGSCGEMQVCVGGTCEAAGLVFVSSTKSDAALGGPRGADMTCAELAEAAGLGGYWFSWTSDPCTSPFKRFEKSTVPYRMLDGTQISPNWNRMTMNPPPLGEGYLDDNINIDETGEIPAKVCTGSTNPPDGCYVWTNTTVEGRVSALAHNNGCLGLTTNDSMFAPSAAGFVTSSQGGWTERQTWTCGTDNLRMYCFEQSTADPIP